MAHLKTDQQHVVSSLAKTSADLGASKVAISKFNPWERPAPSGHQTVSAAALETMSGRSPTLQKNAIRNFETVSKLARHKTSFTNKQSGFTLLEVILAIAITGFLLAAATAFVVSVSRIWIDREERHFFEDHVDGVTEFLQASFSSAGQEISIEAEDSNTNNSTNNDSQANGTTGNPGNLTIDMSGTTTDEKSTADNQNNGSTTDSESTSGGLLRTAEEPITWGSPPGFAEYKDPLLNFKLTQIPPLLVNLDNAPITGINIFLHFEPDEGLSFLWYSLLQEDTEDIDDLRRTEISPLVTNIKYIYWDESFEKWEEEDEPMEGDGDDQFILPRFIKLTFEYEGETKERTLTIPVPSTSVLLF
ncbi:MAG: PulJ/GspJ family protein [Opitutaceae bacterium]